MIRSRSFGRLPGGCEVRAHTLSIQGIELEVLSYGGIVSRLLVPDRNGQMQDVTLGFGRMEPYLAGHPYFGCLTGRVAGRITAGTFDLASRRYSLALNNGPNHLHGGPSGFDKKVWEIDEDSCGASPALRLRCASPDGDEGYPGNLQVQAVYRLLPPSVWEIEYEARTDRATLVNLTQHAYFNLAGEGRGTIENHHLQIDANFMVPTDGDLTLLEKSEAVQGRPDDLRSSRRLGDILPDLLHQHGNLYGLGASTELRRVARLTEPSAGRCLEVWSDEPALQFYSGSFLDGGLTGKSGRPYPRHAGLCLECQRYPMPDGPTGFGSPLLYPGEIYRQKTQYRFSCF